MQLLDQVRFCLATRGLLTFAGGEIRDEGSVGRGSKPKTGLCGYAVSDLNIPGFTQPWELEIGKPDHISSSLEIMLEAPIGAASFNNEFGRPCTTGFWRTLLVKVPLERESGELRGYHKPIMIAGGLGSVRPSLMLKEPNLVPAGAYLIVIGGPAMLVRDLATISMAVGLICILDRSWRQCCIERCLR